MFGRVLAAVIVLAVALVLLVIGWPQLLGLEQVDGVLQVVALRGACALMAIVLVVLLLLAMAAARRARRFLGAFVVLLVAFIALQGVALGSRGLVPGSIAAAGDTTITVLSWNTKGGAVPAQELAELATQSEADVIALPETTARYAGEVRDLLVAARGEWQLFTAAYDEISPARSTSLLVSRRLGAYTSNTEQATTGQLPSVVAMPADGDGPTIVAVHAVSPTDPTTWRNDIAWLADACAAGDDVIMAGDFNSTIDHWAHHIDTSVPRARLGACLDAAEAGGQGGQGTWPTNVPALLGSPIDHVLASAGWRFVGFRVIGAEDDAGSDHRPILARLAAG